MTTTERLVRVYCKTIVTALVVALAALSVPSVSHAATWDTHLQWWVHNSLITASWSSGSLTKATPKRVYVKCYADRYEFEQGLIRRGTGAWEARHVIAYYVPGKSTVNMRAQTCLLAHRFSDGWITQESAGAFKTLLHEAIHRQGISNERMTEAYAIGATRAAGWLAEWNRRLRNGAVDEDAAWEGSEYKGERAMELAWRQSQAWISTSYAPSWSFVSQLVESASWNDDVNVI
jgi:hypothetical protein